MPAVFGHPSPMAGSGACDGEGAREMNPQYGLPLVVTHIDQHSVANNAGVIHDHIEPVEGLKRLCYQAISAYGIRNVLIISQSNTSGGFDLVCNDVRRSPGTAKIVNHYLGSFGRQEQGVFAADASPSARDNGHAVLADAARTHGRPVRRFHAQAATRSGMVKRRSNVPTVI